MSKLFSFVCASATTLLATTTLSADDVFTPKEVPLPLQPLTQAEISSIHQQVIPQENLETHKLPIVKKAPFSAFTGKVKGSKVRVRLQPDLSGKILKELLKNDLVSVVDEEGDFWAIQAPEGIKAYVFRSFVLDNVVEGNRVNIRLEPNLEAPVIGHLNSGDKIKSVICPVNNKWLEISPPSQAKFYVAKEFIEHVGGPELKNQLDKRKTTVDQLFEGAALLSKSEMLKSFEEIDFERIRRSYDTIISQFTDFPESVEQAKSILSSLHDAYVEKRISHLESKTAASTHPIEEPSTQMRISEALLHPNDRMKMWEPIEEALYLTWSHLNEEKDLDDYYKEQELVAVSISGILEAYSSPVKNKPGDYILKDKDLPVAYIYSTKIDLQNFVGKKVNLVGSPRPNNNFAFPAYYVHTVQ